MEQANDIYSSAPITPYNKFEEENSSFDIMAWLMKFVRVWYLFVICISLALFFAYLQNRKWQPEYQIEARMMIEENKNAMYGGLGNGFMQGFGVQAGYRNVNNQIIMFGSRDLTRKVIGDLPSFTVDYYTQGRFKTNNLYKQSPAQIEHVFIAPEAYGLEFTIVDVSGGYKISWEVNDREYSVKGIYGLPMKHSLFSLLVNKTDLYRPGYKINFRFLDKESLVDDYNGRLAFDFVSQGSSVVKASLTGKVAERDIDFLNKLCEAFLADNLARKNEVASKTIQFIDEQMNGISDSIAVSEGRLKSFRVSNQIVDVSSLTGQLLGDAKKLEMDNAAFKLKETYFTYLKNYLKKNIQDEIIVLPTTIGISDPSLLMLVNKFNDLQNKKRDVGVKNPYYAKYNTELGRVKASMLEVIGNMRATLDIEKNDLNSKAREIQSKIAQLPTQESQMANYQRKFKLHDDYYTFLLQKKAESQIQKASNSPDNVLLEQARIVSVTNGDVTRKTKTMYLVIALLLPIAFVLIRELLNNKIVDKKDVEKYSPYPYLGAIKHTSTKDPVPVQKSPRSGLAESYRVIRTRVEFVVQRQHPTSILITSTESGDGKTAFSMNMASMYALTGRKTVVVDLDLRKPSIASRLGINYDAKKGVSNYLIGQVDTLEELILKDTKFKFDIIPGGTIPPNPGELIRSEKLKQMFKDLCAMYDHVIIDTSPVGLVADAYALMHKVDANLFLVRSEKTNKMFFKSVLQQVHADKFEHVYVVLNDVDEKKNSYSYYHEYGRRSYYMKKDEYHTYAKEYFDEDESSNKSIKRNWLGSRKK